MGEEVILRVLLSNPCRGVQTLEIAVQIAKCKMQKVKIRGSNAMPKALP
jgi:hypothetical protein